MKIKMNSVLEEVLQDICLSKEQEFELKKIANEFINKLKKHNLNVGIGGSLAKNTLIKKKTQDIDIFVVFNSEKEIGRLEIILKQLKLKLKKVHGSRDYFQVNISPNVIIEVIPVLKIKKKQDVDNVTDFSLSHVNYIRNKIKKDSKLANQIKLAKVFCHAQDCYGAESYIKGFSGYSLEVLVCYFGGFINFLKNIGKEKYKIIDPEKYFKNKQQILWELNESKLKSGLIIIDPTYKYRNVCAGLSKETFEKFLKSVNNFLKFPSIKAFEKQEINFSKIKSFAKKRNAKLLKIIFKTEKQEGDIAGTKMRKFFDFICSEFERKSQKVLQKEFVYEKGNSATVYLIIKEKKQIERKGPPINDVSAVYRFKKAHKTVKKKGKFLYVHEKTSIQDVLKFLKRFEKDMNVKINII